MNAIRVAIISAVIMGTALSFAAPVNSNNPQGIAAVYSAYPSGSEPSYVILCVDGSVNHLSRTVDPPFTWEHGSLYNYPASVPVPVSDIQDWTPGAIVTTSGDIYFWHIYNQEWLAMSIPGNFSPLECDPPVGIESSTLGEFKSQFR
ncbi:MAG: hypothetical protein DRP71_11540 [Verrucomicrobia bacterium]|nr:MAG: hypothetical protein DRP71_11540 [Verrucomicrobiota bacterium]